MGYATIARHHSVAMDVALAAQNSPSTTRDVITARLAPFLEEGEVMPDAGLLQELLGRFLKAQGQDLLDADSVYLAQIRDHRMQLPDLREAMDQVRTSLRDIRHVFDRDFGPEKTDRLLETRNFTTRRPAKLILLAKTTLAALRTPDAEIGESGLPGVTTERLAAGLERNIQVLEEVHLDRVGTVRRNRKVELGHKEAQLGATKAAISQAASLLKGLLTFTGRAYLTKGLLPSHRKKGKAEPKPKSP